MPALKLFMHHIFAGPDRLRAFWEAVGAYPERTLSLGAASVILRCSYSNIQGLLTSGELEAWSYQSGPGQPPLHLMISIASLVRCGIRTGLFASARERGLQDMKITEDMFDALKVEVLAGRED